MKKLTTIALTLLVSLFMIQSCTKEDITATMNTPQYEVFHKQMQKLWADHMQWTFTTVDAFFNNTNALEGNLTRLLQNQQDLGDAIVPYYGQEAGTELARLLTEHIELAVPVLTAAQEGNETALGVGLEDWYRNAEEVGEFLNSANPHWEEHDMRPMMKTHIDQTVEYSVLLLQGDYHAAIKAFDEANSHMVDMADHLSEGIANHFPDKF